jgi:hypothetical protein
MDKKPGRFWYAWQYLQAFKKAQTHITTKLDVKKMLRDSGFSAGSVAAGILISVSGLYIPLLVPFGTGLVTTGVAGWYGWQAYQKAKLLKESGPVYNHIKEQERLWQEKKNKKRGEGFGQRLKERFKKSPVEKRGAGGELPSTRETFEKAAEKQQLSTERQKAAAARASNKKRRPPPASF